MKEGCPLSIFRRPMTAASVPSSIMSASVKAKSIYTSVSMVSDKIIFFPACKIYNGDKRIERTWAPSSWLPTFIPAFSASLAQITDLADQPQEPIRRNGAEQLNTVEIGVVQNVKNHGSEAEATSALTRESRRRRLVTLAGGACRGTGRRAPTRRRSRGRPPCRSSRTRPPEPMSKEP